ncbi:MAG: hypothetical protein HC905_01450 [Bacteroidales bacterium]|nr:hypothetical protein [Bacteroidales bacterium]
MYAIPKGEDDYFGIQCKGKDEYTDTKLNKKEVDEEILKALSFKPSLKHSFLLLLQTKMQK